MDPIAVDVPAKAPPPAPSGVSGVAGLGARPPVTVATPPGISAKVDALLRSEPGKPAAPTPAAKTPTATTPPAAAVATPTSWLGKAALVFGLQPTKRQAVIAASAAVSLAVGVGLVRTVWPGSSGPKPDVALHHPPAAEGARPTPAPAKPVEPPPAARAAPEVEPTPRPVPTKPPALFVEPASPVPVVPAGGPVMPVLPPLPAATPVAPPAVPPVVPASADGFKPSTGSGTTSPPVFLPPLPTETVSPGASKSGAGAVAPPVDVTPPLVTPVGASEPAKPMLPPLPASPAAPAVPPPVLPPLPADGAKPATPTPPASPLPGPALPPLPTGTGMTTPSAPAVPPLVPPVGPTPPAVPPVGPATPVGGKPPEAAPAVPPVAPALPTPPSVSPPVSASPPASVTPPPAAVPPVVSVSPPASTTSTPGGPPSMLPPSIEPVKPMEFVKPAGTTEVKPVVVPERAATTSFDVDLHEPKRGDTYESVSRDFYNDARYAAALREYNGRRPLQGSVRIEVPPIHVLRKRYPQLVGAAATPVGRGTDGWGPAGGTGGTGGSAGDLSPVFRASGAKTFTVPAGGMSLTAVAREVLGSASRWKEIYDLNPQVAPNDVPAGTVLKLPDAKPN